MPTALWPAIDRGAPGAEPAMACALPVAAGAVATLGAGPAALSEYGLAEAMRWGVQKPSAERCAESVCWAELLTAIGAALAGTGPDSNATKPAAPRTKRRFTG